MQAKKTRQKISVETAKPLSSKVLPVNTNFFSGTKMQYLVIVIVSLLIYSNTLFFKYALDDGLIITDNKVTKKGFSGLGEIFTKNSFYGVFGDKANKFLPGGRYRPLSQALFAVEYQIFGLSPFIGHLFNVLLYGLLCMLLLKVLKITFEKYDTGPWYVSVPFIATLLFTCHPLHTEVVANIKGCDELLALTGSLAAWYFSIMYFKNQKFTSLLLIFIVYTLALLSKENAVTFMAIIPLSLFFAYKKTIKNYLIILIPLFLGLAVYAGLRYNALGFINTGIVSKELLDNPFLHTTVIQKYATIFFTWGKYLILVLFPHSLTHDYYPYQVPLLGFSDYRVILSIIVYLALIVFSLIRIKYRNLIAYAILFFLITFSISSNLVFNIGTFMNERFMFAPLLGFTLAVSYSIVKYFNRKNTLLAAKIILTTIVTLYSIKTFSRNFAWKDSFTLYTTDVKTSANSAKANAGAGEMLIKSVNEKTPDVIRIKTIEKAIGYLKKSVEIYPGFTSGWVYLGYGQHLLKDYKGSHTSLVEALKLENTNSDAVSYLYNDALTCYHVGNIRQAEENFKALVRYVPEHSEYEYLLAEIYTNTNRIDSALVLLNTILAKNPQFDKAYNKLGEIYGRVFHDFDKSFEYLNKAYDLNPTNIETLRNLGTAYGLQHDFQKSLRYLLKAEKVKPDDKDILNKLSVTYMNLGDKKMAEEYAVKAK